MANSIKGITIELNGDTTGLTDALKDVNKATRNTASELKQVERALQMNPGNTELIAQRQELLAQQISNTTTRLDTLRTAQAQVQAQFERGEIGGDQYRAFQRELIRTEGQLESLQRRAQQDVNVDVEADTRDVNKLKDAIEELPGAASKAAKGAAVGIAGIGTAAAGATVGMTAFVESQKEMAMDMARLSTNAEQAGMSMDSVNVAFEKVAAVSGEADSAVEAVSNLLATGMNENQLAEALDYINGGAIKFSDTLKTEGIADGIQETFASGKAIGPFAEILERSGVNLETFDAGLAKAQATGEGMNYILDQMSKLGLKETYDGYMENNSAIAEYNLAQAEAQRKLAELSNSMRPLVTEFMEFGNTLLDVALGNKTLGEAFEEIKAKIKSVLPSLKEFGSETLDNILNGMQEIAPELASFIQDTMLEMYETVIKNAPEFLEAGIDIVSNILEGISEFLPKAAEKAVELLETVISTIIDKLPEILDTGVEIVTNLLQGIQKMLPQLVAAALQLIVQLAATIIKNLPKIIEAGVNILKALIEGIVMTIGALGKAIITQVIPSIFKAFLGKDWASIGKDVISGIAKGITSFGKKAVEAITGVVNSVVKKAKSLLKISSPSKVFTEFGEWVGIGLADGIESTESLNEKIMKSLTDKIIDVKEDSKDKLIKIDKELAKNIQSANEKSEDKILKIQQAAAKKKRALTSDEAKQIEKLRQEAADKITKLEEKAVTDRAKISADEKKQTEEHYKALFDSVKTFVDNKKSLNQMSIVDEATMWRESMQLFAEGSDHRIKAQQEYQKVTSDIQKQLADTNKTYSSEFKKIVENQIKQEETLTKAYEDAVNKRSQSLYSFKNLFDEFKSEIEVTGDQLLANLGSQVNGFREWQREIEALSSKAIDEGLLAELREMGPNALPQLKALNSLTSDQLQRYSDLYKEKSKLARKQAEAELKGMKADTEQQIRSMKSAANRELTQLEREWNQKIKDITQGTQTQLMTLTQIGTEAARGLLNGLSSMDGELSAKAKSMADNISSTIKDALKVKSPSRLTQEIGVNVGEGLIVGMDDMIRKVAQSSNRLSGAVASAYGSLSSSAAKSNTYGATTNNATTNNNSTSVTVNLSYSGASSQNDVMQMVNILERELSKRFNNQTRMQGLKG